MLNKTVMVGRFTKDVELRYTPNKTAVITGTIAVTRNFKDKRTQEYEADFFNIVAYGKMAEIIANQSCKGILASIVGRMQTRNYENQQGQRIYITELVVEEYSRLEAMDARKGGNSQSAGNSSAGSSSPFGEMSSYDISDDDLPF